MFAEDPIVKNIMCTEDTKIKDLSKIEIYIGNFSIYKKPNKQKVCRKHKKYLKIKISISQ